MQRIFNRITIHDTSLNPDKVLNSWMHKSPFCIIIYISYIIFKMLQFLWPTQYKSKHTADVLWRNVDLFQLAFSFGGLDAFLHTKYNKHL